MKKLLLFFVFIVTFSRLYAQQNLVPNPSFEEHIDCPDNGGQLEEHALHWTSPLTGGGVSPDYLNACGIPSWSVPNNLYGLNLHAQG